MKRNGVSKVRLLANFSDQSLVLATDVIFHYRAVVKNYFPSPREAKLLKPYFN
jgi:hypothetical protein